MSTRPTLAFITASALALAALVPACSNSSGSGDAAATTAATSAPPARGAPGGAEVSLGDIQDVADDAAAESWVSVQYNTMISYGRDVELDSDAGYTVDGVEEAAVPFTPQEALDACNALVRGLAERVPAVTVTVRHGSEVLATGSKDGCRQ